MCLLHGDRFSKMSKLGKTFISADYVACFNSAFLVNMHIPPTDIYAKNASHVDPLSGPLSSASYDPHSKLLCSLTYKCKPFKIVMYIFMHVMYVCFMHVFMHVTNAQTYLSRVRALTSSSTFTAKTLSEWQLSGKLSSFYSLWYW